MSVTADLADAQALASRLGGKGQSCAGQSRTLGRSPTMSACLGLWAGVMGRSPGLAGPPSLAVSKVGLGQSREARLAWRKLCSGHQRGGLLGPPRPALCLGAAPQPRRSPHLGSDEGASSAQGQAARAAATSARDTQVACGFLCWLKAQHTACAVLRSQWLPRNLG